MCGRLPKSLYLLGVSRPAVYTPRGAQFKPRFKLKKPGLQVYWFKAVAEIYNKIEPLGSESDDEWQSLRVMLTRREIARFFHMDRTFWSSET